MGQPTASDQPRPPLVCVILGQTAAGKSRMALDVAERLEGEIVSMDALKVYRGMDIGTAKPAPGERRGIPHHMLDLVSHGEQFSVAHYLKAEEPVLRDIISRGRLPVVDCGTPMYLAAFLDGLVEGPEPEPELRARLEAADLAELRRELEARDPVAAARLHPNDRARLVRALEYAMQTGEPLSARQTTFGQRRDDLRFVLTGPLWRGDALRGRIDARIDGMLAAGLEDEVRRLRESGEFSRTAGHAIGYRQMLEYFDGVHDRDEAIRRIRNRTWQFARRQLMWFRRHPDVKWLSVGEEAELTRGAVFVCTEMLGEMRATLHGVPIGLRREPRASDVRRPPTGQGGS